MCDRVERASALRVNADQVEDAAVLVLEGDLESRLHCASGPVRLAVDENTGSLS